MEQVKREWFTVKGVAAVIGVLWFLLNAYASTQLLPITGKIKSNEQRIENLEKRLSDQEVLIIPREVIDVKFSNIERQLEEIKETLRDQ